MIIVKVRSGHNVSPVFRGPSEESPTGSALLALVVETEVVLCVILDGLLFDIASIALQ